MGDEPTAFELQDRGGLDEGDLLLALMAAASEAGARLIVGEYADRTLRLTFDGPVDQQRVVDHLTRIRGAREAEPLIVA